MNIELPPEVERSLVAAAKQLGITTETFVLDTLQERLETIDLREPNDAWEALLRSVGSPTGLSLTDEAISRQDLYH